jgi:hypothetical protein
LKVINIGENVSTTKWVSPFAKQIVQVPSPSAGRASPTIPDTIHISDLPADGNLHPMMIVSVKTQSKTVRPQQKKP